MRQYSWRLFLTCQHEFQHVAAFFDLTNFFMTTLSFNISSKYNLVPMVVSQHAPQNGKTLVKAKSPRLGLG